MNLNLTVVSDSMMPVISINTQLEISEKTKALQTFDIIVFTRHGRLVAHYVWKNQYHFNKTIITRSLKSIYNDEEPVGYSEIAGVVTNCKIGFLQRCKIRLLCLLNGAYS